MVGFFSLCMAIGFLGKVYLTPALEPGFFILGSRPVRCFSEDKKPPSPAGRPVLAARRMIVDQVFVFVEKSLQAAVAALGNVMRITCGWRIANS
jgi:hypothetical protein